jgi:DNA-binding NarL/FixJ family response regulator
VRGSEGLVKDLHSGAAAKEVAMNSNENEEERRSTPAASVAGIKITARDQQVLQLLLEGCSNKEIAAQLRISPRTVKQHLRTLFLRAGIRDGRKRVKLATALFQKEKMEPCHQETD